MDLARGARPLEPVLRHGWWSPSDLQALFALVPPGQILMASDAPYATPAYGATMGMRHGLQVGLDPEVVREVVGGQALRLIEREDPLDLGPAPGIESLSRDPLLERVYSYLLSAIGQMFAGVEPTETLALAELACDVGEAEGDPHGRIYEASEDCSRRAPPTTRPATAVRRASHPVSTSSSWPPPSLARRTCRCPTRG